MKKRSVNIMRHATSISLEDAFWDALKAEAEERDLSLNALISEIDKAAEKVENYNLSSAIRVHILRRLQIKLAQQSPQT